MGVQQPVLPERGSEADAGARKRVFQKMAGSEAWSEEFLYIYIQKKTCRMSN